MLEHNNISMDQCNHAHTNTKRKPVEFFLIFGGVCTCVRLNTNVVYYSINPNSICVPTCAHVRFLGALLFRLL